MMSDCVLWCVTSFAVGLVVGLGLCVASFAAGLALGMRLDRALEITRNADKHDSPAADECADEEDEEDDAGGDWWEHGRKPLGDAG